MAKRTKSSSRRHGEKGETAEMEARAHSPAFLKRAAAKAGKRGGKRGGKEY